ncbi:hypothetical protein GCM10027161_37480 [Microbispora hainanensis]
MIVCEPLLSVGVFPQPEVAAATALAEDGVAAPRLSLSAMRPEARTRSAAAATAVKMDLCLNFTQLPLSF